MQIPRFRLITIERCVVSPGLLDLPIELRVLIYKYVLAEGHLVIFSSAKLQGSDSERKHRLQGRESLPFPGLPPGHIPFITTQWSPNLLQATKPAVVPVSSPVRPEESGICFYSPISSVLLVNHQMRAEVLQHVPSAADQGVDVFLSYPHGLHVFDTIGSHIITAARSVQITGQYITRDVAALGSAYSPHDDAEQEALQHQTYSKPYHAQQLDRLLSRIVGLQPRPIQLHMRILYPGNHANGNVWNVSSSPTGSALQSIPAVDMIFESFHAPTIVGVYLAARPSKDGQGHMVFRDRRNSDLDYMNGGCGWAIDERWPVVTWEVPDKRVVDDSAALAERRAIVLAQHGFRLDDNGVLVPG